jgi:hypothetical protein
MTKKSDYFALRQRPNGFIGKSGEHFALWRALTVVIGTKIEQFGALESRLKRFN